MSNFKRIVLLLFTNICIQCSMGQDVHFSQYYNAPLLLNPAFTGFTQGITRINIQHRNQWFSATNNGFFKSPYMTTSASVDAPFKIKNDILGAGLFIASDQAGANTFSTVITQASVSYIKTLGKKNNHRLAAGFQIGYTYQSIKVENFQFASQFDDNNEFNPAQTSYNPENIGRGNIGYLNLNFGMLWYSKLSDKFAMYTGGSFYNVTTPSHNILPNQKRDLYWRWNAHGGLDIFLGKKYHILPSGMFMRQGVNDQLNTGLAFGVDFDTRRTNNGMAMTLGVFNRIHNLTSGVTSDAIITYVSYEGSGFKVGFSYDATISKLKNAGSGVGALELMLGYTIKSKDFNYRNSPICPRL
ncbi:MAG: PorP/SprF family type IX secretion system membrane protein [Chitinophagales bacterium]